MKTAPIVPEPPPAVATPPAAKATKPHPTQPNPEEAKETPSTSLRERQIEYVFDRLKKLHLISNELLDELMKQAVRNVV